MPDQERVPRAAAADSPSHGPGIGQLLAAGAAADAVSKPPPVTPSRAAEEAKAAAEAKARTEAHEPSTDQAA